MIFLSNSDFRSVSGSSMFGTSGGAAQLRVLLREPQLQSLGKSLGAGLPSEPSQKPTGEPWDNGGLMVVFHGKTIGKP